jgi:DNA adenine methylase
VRVLCGDFERVLTHSATTRHGLTAVFLDPPYSKNERTPQLYANENGSVADRSYKWAIENGSDPLMRIALCGYDTEHKFPDSWTPYRWKSNGGYGNQSNGSGRANSHRETIWFSPHCLPEGVSNCLSLK